MFTGLIEKTCQVVKTKARPGGLELVVSKPSEWNDLNHGESISIDGACLTLAGQNELGLVFFISQETLDKTTLGTFKEGCHVNLERALQYGSRVGGHFVQGHVDGVGKVLTKENRGETLFLEISVGKEQMKWVIPKGSITVNGVSLTVNSLNRADGTVSLMLIPETLKLTNLESLDRNSSVNIEYDQMVKIIAEQFQIARKGYELHN